RSNDCARQAARLAASETPSVPRGRVRRRHINKGFAAQGILTLPLAFVSFRVEPAIDRNVAQWNIHSPKLISDLEAHHSKATKNKNARITDLTHLVCPDKADGATDRFPIGALSRRPKLDVSF